MRVLIDCTGIARKKAGVGVYAVNLIDALTRSENGTQYFLLLQDDDPDLDFSRRRNVTNIKVPARVFRRFPLRFLLEQLVLPMLLLWHRIDVLHSLHYAFPLMRFGTKQVVTLHDMTFFSMPEAHERIKIVYFRFFIRADIRCADMVIFVSHSAMQDCVARLGPPRRHSVVIHHGKSDAYRVGLVATEVQRVRDKYGLKADFILYIGTIEPRKNLPRLVTAFGLLRQRHPRLLLVIAGMKGWMYDELLTRVRDLDLQSSVIFTGFVPEEEKPYLIAGAKAFAYPSLYEGFGIPVLEALSCGIPTVTSNISSLPEVAGDAALTIDPTSVEDLSSALERLVSDEQLRRRLMEASLRQAARFTWANTALLTLQAYERVLHAA